MLKKEWSGGKLEKDSGEKNLENVSGKQEIEEEGREVADGDIRIMDKEVAGGDTVVREKEVADGDVVVTEKEDEEEGEEQGAQRMPTPKEEEHGMQGISIPEERKIGEEAVKAEVEGAVVCGENGGRAVKAEEKG